MQKGYEFFSPPEVSLLADQGISFPSNFYPLLAEETV